MDEMKAQSDSPANGYREQEDPLAEVWDLYHRELRRWNRQINLVSRFQGEANLANLTGDCWDAADTLPRVISLFSHRWAAEFWPDLAAGQGTDFDPQPTNGSSAFPGPGHPGGSRSGLASGTSGPCGQPVNGEKHSNRIVYVDIGSGAGFPGIAWHLWLQTQVDKSGSEGRFSTKTTLVEPRQKRAWFLHRVNRLLKLENLRIWEKRWQDCHQDTKPSRRHWHKTLWLFSLRALKMSDKTVIASWQKAAGLTSLEDSHRLLICRFRPQGHAPDSALREALCLPSSQITPDQPHSDADGAWVVINCGQRVSLLASWYRRIPHSHGE